ncbi:MAG: LuxR C-terminal-related transcriptional regulator [Litorimonas sp.]
MMTLKNNKNKPMTAISTVEDIHNAAVALRDRAKDLGGYKVAACANIAAKSPMVDGEGNILASSVFAWIEADDIWWKRPQMALNSPIPRACRYEAEAFWCNAKAIHSRGQNMLLGDIDLSKFSDHVGPAALICVPIHMPFGQIGAVSFSVPDQGKDDLSDEFEKHGYELENLARVFVTSYVKVMDQRNWIPKNCKLSKREVQCVSWAALGKTDREIALILSRSCATVRFHLHNAAKKLDAVSRSQTVFKASQLGYLGAVAVE